MTDSAASTNAVPIIVTGFHRSGTSMTMQTLVRAGLHAGNSLIGAQASNVDGHFEDIESVSLHDRWLAAAGSDWCHAGPLPRLERESASKDVQAVLARLRAGINGDVANVDSAPCAFGLKDPRAALFLNAWFESAPDAVGVFVYRHYASCLDSLQRRQADELLERPDTSADAVRFWACPEDALASWATHNRALLDQIRRYPNRCVLVSQESILQGLDLAALVRDRFGVRLQIEADNGVDARKAGSPREVALPATVSLEDLDAIWRELQVTSASPAASEALPTVVVDDVCPGAEQESASDWEKPGIVRQRVEMRSPREALAWIRTGLTFNPTAPHLHAHAGRLLHSLGLPHEAEPRLRDALTVQPDDASVRFHLALTEFSLGQQAAARERLYALLIEKPNPDHQLVLIGWCMDAEDIVSARELADSGRRQWPADRRFIGASVGACLAMSDAESVLVIVDADDDQCDANMARYRRDALALLGDDHWRTAHDAYQRRVVAGIPNYNERVERVLDTIGATPAGERLADRWKSRLAALSDSAISARNVEVVREIPRIAMTVLVRDEVDVIEHNLRYHHARGVTRFVVTDNASVDGTRELLLDLQRELPIELIDEPSHTIDQDLWVTRMAHRVAATGDCDWVIHNDADEFWIPEDGHLGSSVAAALAAEAHGGEGVGVLSCHRQNLLTPNQPNSQHFLDNVHAVLRAVPLAPGEDAWNDGDCNSVARPVMDKVLTRIDGLGDVGYGNHDAHHELDTAVCSTILIRHYPVRSREQFERKVVNYGQSLERNTRFSPGASLHLRYWYRCWQQGRLDDIYAQVTFTPERLRDLLASEAVEQVPPLDTRAGGISSARHAA